jgi:Xaa-Pro aminopeptidase
LVLLDCGVCCDLYAGDITRTLPISGKFSAEQATVFGALLKLQKRLITEVKPGATWSQLTDSMDHGIFAIAQELGVLPQGPEYDWKLADFFVPHGLSHHIRCNPHDHCGYENEDSKITDSIHRQYTLAPGHAISIEPRFYFHLRRLEQIKPDDAPLNQINIARATELANAVGAIRIEDDVAVTEDGFEVLSPICPKKIAEIEGLLAKAA